MNLFQATFAAFILSFGLCVALIATQRLHGRWTQDQTNGVQKVHQHRVARVGGLAVLAGMAGLGALMSGLLVTLLLAALPAFAAGLAEDLTKKVAVRLRLAATLVSGALVCLMTGYFLDLPGLPPLFLFSAFAVAGIAHGVNIIDELNGLAGGAVLIALAAFGIVAAGAGDGPLLGAVVVAAGAVAGFLALNFPSGRIFLGDGGAYLLGILLAAFAVALPARNPDVSVFVGLVVLAYPVIETLTSMVRRSKRRGGNPTQADRLHLHSLLHRRRSFAHAMGHPAMGWAAAVVVPWCLCALAALCAVLWQQVDGLLLLSMVPLAGIYLALYRRAAGMAPRPPAARPGSRLPPPSRVSP